MQPRAAASLLLVLGVAFGLMQGSARAADSCQANAYLFSPDARFVRIDLPDARMADVGNLWFLNLHRVLNVLADPQGQDLLLVTQTWKMLGIEDPTRAEFDRPGVAVLTPDHQGRLTAATVIPPLFGTDPVADGHFFELDGLKLLLTYYSGEQRDRIATGVYDRSYKLLRTIQGFPATERSCLSSSGQIWTTMPAQPSRALQLDWASGNTESRVLDHIGNPESFSRTPLAFSPGCIDLFYEKRNREGADGMLLLYDLVSDQVISSFQIDRYADYRLLEDGKYILEDEKEFTPILDQGGQPLGLQQHKLGRLHLRDGESGQVLASLSLPAGGHVAALGCQDSTAFYLSPGQLTVVDLKLLKVAASLPIPFDEAFLLLAGTR